MNGGQTDGDLTLFVQAREVRPVLLAELRRIGRVVSR